MTGRFIEVDGGKLYAHVRNGRDGLAMVFLHYWGGSHRTWTPVIERIGSQYGVVAYDHRGWGASNEVPGPFGLEQLADDAHRVIETLGLSRYIVIGHSLGGKTAQILASRRPAGLKGLILVGSAPPKPIDIDPGQQEIMVHAYDSAESINQSIDGPLTKRELSPELRQQIIEDSSRGSEGTRRDWPYHGIVMDISSQVSAIDVPVLVLVGVEDEVDPPSTLNDHLVPYIAASVRLLPGVGHLSMLEAPDEIAEYVMEFAATVDAA